MSVSRERDRETERQELITERRYTMGYNKPLDSANLGERVLVLANGREITASISLYMYLDEGIDTSWMEPDDISRLERGDLVPVTVVVRAYYRGLEGTDSLGGVLLSGRAGEVDEIVGDHGMVMGAMDELRSSINYLLEELGVQS